MQSLFLWQPVQIDSQVIETVITPSESFKVARGGPLFVGAIKKTLGLPAVETWKITPFRCQFFSTAGRDWTDRWPLSWSLSMHTVGNQPLPDLSEGPIGVNADDETWTAKDDVDAIDHVECRVIADFARAAQAEAAAQHIQAEGLRPTLLPVGRMSRLSVSLGLWKAAAYPARLVEAERIVSLCKASGGATTHAESFRMSSR